MAAPARWGEEHRETCGFGGAGWRHRRVIGQAFLRTRLAARGWHQPSGSSSWESTAWAPTPEERACPIDPPRPPRLLPGEPVAEADPRRRRRAGRRAARRAASPRASPRSWSATTTPAPATSASSSGRPPSSGFASPHGTCRADATQADLHRVIAELQRRPGACTGCSSSTRCPAHLDYDAALQTRRPGQGRRRHAPAEHGAARARACPARCRARPPASRRCWRTTTSRSPGREVVILGRGATLGPPAGDAAGPEAPDRQRRRHRRAHRGARLAPLHPARRHPRRRGRRARHHPARARQARRRRHRRRRALRGPAAAARRRRVLRRGRRRDHPAGRRGRPDHGRDAVPQRRRRRRAATGRHAG